MNITTIGKNIRKYRKKNELRQEDLAEMANLSPNYVGMIERGEKVPSLETFIIIANALGVSADMLLTELITTNYITKASELSNKLDRLPPEERQKILDVVDTLLRHSN